ncbi:MAG: hypothetical protein ABJN65_09255 [Parasphingorhabdus sp.]
MKIADFVICSRCGVCLAAIEKDGGQARAVVNLNCIDSHQNWSKKSCPVDFDNDNETGRVQRHQKNWMPVQIIKKQEQN